MVDHRELLKRYIGWVGFQEGTTYIYSEQNPDTYWFSDEEWAELQVLDKEEIIR